MTLYDYIVITTIIIIGQIIPAIFSKLSAIIFIPQTQTHTQPYRTHAQQIFAKVFIGLTRAIKIDKCF